MALAAAAGAQTTELQSRTVVSGNSGSSSQSISADGRFVAFSSNASNLVAGDTNGGVDVFVLDTATGTTERVSVSTGGAQANQPCDGPKISGDGRFVAFVSAATNLVAGDVNGHQDVFLRDRLNSTTTLVSIGAGGVQANADCDSPCMSPDGRFVAFRTTASNLLGGDTNGTSDIYLRDLQSNTIQRLSLTAGGAEANGGSYAPAITPDGRYTVFVSDATNLVAGDTNGVRDVFVRDRQAATTVRASLSFTGAQANNGCFEPVCISADGRWVCFHSGATNLVSGISSPIEEVYLRDLVNNDTEIESITPANLPGNNSSYSCAMTPDARYFVMASYATNLGPVDTNGVLDVYVLDRPIGTMTRVSVATNGAEGNQATGFAASISADGKRVTFASNASNLVQADGNGSIDVFLHDIPAGTTSIVSGVVQTAGAVSEAPVVSADGNLVAFQSDASDLVPGDANGKSDIFLRNRTAGTIARISLSTGGGDANGASYVPAMTPDGRYVAFASEASNLVANDTNLDYDVFLRDRQLGTTELVSVATDGTQGDWHSGYAPPSIGGVPMGISISPDGRYVAFGSVAYNLDPPHGVSTQGEVFLRDRVAGTTEIVSVTSTGGVDNGSTYAPSVSADGRYVVYHSFASNIVPGDANGFIDVYMRDRLSGTTSRLSVANGGGDANGASSFPAISADGRFVAFYSSATNLLPGGSSGVFVRNLASGTTELASVSSTGVPGNGGVGAPPCISADGRFVAFTSSSTNLVAGDTNGASDVFLRDRATGTTSLVSLSSGGAQGNGTSGTYNLDQNINVSISPDGRFVGLASLATNFALNDGNAVADVFLRDRAVGSAFVPFCFGDGTGAACPCANSGMPGHGCENSSMVGGALLSATGTASLSADTVHFMASSVKSTATCVLLQGTLTVSSIHYGDGLRCVGGTLKRLYMHNAAGGDVIMPQGADVSITARSASFGDVIFLGTTRHYQIYYRDPAPTFCPMPTGSTFNITNAIAVAWGS